MFFSSFFFFVCEKEPFYSLYTLSINILVIVFLILITYLSHIQFHLGSFLLSAEKCGYIL